MTVAEYRPRPDGERNGVRGGWTPKPCRGSTDQLAELFLDAAEDPRFGLADGVRNHPQLGGDISPAAVFRGDLAEGLPGALLELSLHQLKDAPAAPSRGRPLGPRSFVRGRPVRALKTPRLVSPCSSVMIDGDLSLATAKPICGFIFLIDSVASPCVPRSDSFSVPRSQWLAYHV